MTKTCCEALVDLLERYGIEVVFGIPGVHTIELYRGLAGSNLRHVTPRHEQGAGFMADGYARASGKPAACFIISGPGMTNITTAMGQAYADSVPMLVISSVNSSNELGLGEGRLHELPDQQDLVSGVSVFSHRVLHPAELPGLVARAFAVFDSARPGPVHIEIPLDVMTAPGEGLSLDVCRPRARPGPDPQAVARAADLLAGAENPFVVLGGGTQNAAEQARALVERLQAVTALTINAKGVLPADHPLSLGSTLPLAPALDALQTADVVLAVGTELSETDTLLFGSRLDLAGKVVRIDVEAEQLVRNALAEVALCSDASLAMAALSAALPETPPKAHDGAGRAASLRMAIDGALNDAYRRHGVFLDHVAAALPGVVIVGDSTQPVYGGNLAYDPDQPRSWFNSSTGYGTLGYGLPAAFGAKLGCPDRPVAALIGDGGIQFTIAELAAGVELGLPVPVILWNNDGYGEIKTYMIDANVDPVGVDIFTPDFIAIAKGFGCAASEVGSWDELTTALKGADAADRPTVILVDEASVAHW